VNTTETEGNLIVFSAKKSSQTSNHKNSKMPFFGKRDKDKESSKKNTNLLKKDDKSSPSLEDRYELKDLLGT
jgi:hypothetical protein